ncbi:MAG: FAD-dependent oxidoreductase [Pseudonocardia sp.]|nr:FAD-dependent oxidoreductase [Pseudonocardia sp.]
MDTLVADRAVVLGGSIAGLFAARVLADVYAEVVVVERDALPGGCGHRRGVPQDRHIHALGWRGQQAMDELLPGLTAELMAAGAPVGEMLADLQPCLNGHRFRQGPSGLRALCASRPLVEGHVRARVRALPAVRLLERCDVVGLTTTDDGRRVTGARVMRRADGSAEETIRADLVVDATGRGSRAPRWLDELGYGRPAIDRVRTDVGYTSLTYRLPPGRLGGLLGVLVGPTPQLLRGGVVQALEGDRHQVTLFGVLGDHPPVDPAGIDAFARSLRFPDVHRAIQGAEPLVEPVAYRYPASVRHRYERMPRLPDGLLVVGDALCVFNPIYGQGMTVAALAALALRRHLRPGTGPQPARIMRDLGKVIDQPWAMATGADLAFPGVEGRRSVPSRILGRYVQRLQATAARDAAVGRVLARVTGGVDGPQALLHPAVVGRVAAAALRRPGGEVSAAPA